MTDLVAWLRTQLDREERDAPRWTRRRMTTEHLEAVAAIYRKAWDVGQPPTMAVAAHFTVSHGTATRWVREARKARKLGPARIGAAGEFLSRRRKP